ncbi:MAG: (p)ppGpp synthetase, partial [Thermoanaerobaculia bacterium]
ELQLRSRSQHAWATAVETVGTFLQQALKSSEGSESWLYFFRLTGSAFALMEKTPLVPETPTDERELRAAIKQLASKLEVKKTLKAYGQAVQVSSEKVMKSAYYFLLSFMPSPERLTVYGFRRDQLAQATERYLEVEKDQAGIIGAQTVLVSADSLASLRRAYPNYFLDTQVYMNTLSKFMDNPSSS